jgi:uncharacterized protein YdaU (DUF1376 family)
VPVNEGLEDRCLNRGRHALFANCEMVCGTRVLSAGELGDEVGDLNYYKRHIGDYARRTAHLTFIEDAAYNRLLDVYYTREAPIAADIQQACRLVRAASKAERAAVESVLKEFFTLEHDGWHNKRCDEELAADQAFIAKQRANGRASAAKRASNAGSATVQPPLDSGSNQIQPPTPTPTPNLRADPPAGAPVPDPRKALFDLGVSILGESKRGLIGKAVSQIGETKVAEVIAQMAAKPPVGDPTDYFAKATQKPKRGFVC